MERQVIPFGIILLKLERYRAEGRGVQVVQCHRELLGRYAVEYYDQDHAIGLAEKVASLELDLQVISGEVEPTFKQCPGGLMHRASPRGTSPCGWPWRREPGWQVSASEWERACLQQDKVCTKCR